MTLTVSKILAIFAVAFFIFAASGWLAQLIFVATGCVWTSTAGFGLSFLGLGAALLSLANGVWDLSHLF